jgi:hypothetical protein
MAGTTVSRLLAYDHPYRWDQSEFPNSRKIWTPAEMTTFRWHDAYDEDTITDTAGDVSQWDDKSGNSAHLKQTIGGDQPTTGTGQINNLNAIDFNGTADWFRYDSLWSMLDKQMFFVCESRDTTTDFQMFFSQFTNNIYLCTAKTTGLLRYGGGAQRYPTWVSTLGMVDDTPALVWWQTGTGSNTLQGGVNGTIEDSTYTDDGDGTTDLDSVGARYGSQNYWNGYMGEIIVTGILTTAERQKVEGYLAHKWGLESSLPVGHPYLTDVPLIGGV